MNFIAGQRYFLPGFEPAAAANICLVEESTCGTVVHVSLEGLRIPHPYAPGGYLTSIPHLPFTPAALQESLGPLLNSWMDPRGWEEPYREWRLAFELGEACIWELPVFDVLQVHQSLIPSPD